MNIILEGNFTPEALRAIESLARQHGLQVFLASTTAQGIEAARNDFFDSVIEMPRLDSPRI